MASRRHRRSMHESDFSTITTNSQWSNDHFPDIGVSSTLRSTIRNVSPVRSQPIPIRSLKPPVDEDRYYYGPQRLYGSASPISGYAYDNQFRTERSSRSFDPSYENVRNTAPRPSFRHGKHSTDADPKDFEISALASGTHLSPSQATMKHSRRESIDATDLWTSWNPGSVPSIPIRSRENQNLEVPPHVIETLAPGSSRRVPASDAGKYSLAPSLTASTSSAGLPYQYEPISGMQFRVIQLLPATMVMLKCEISHKSLEDPPPYIAVSYAWGELDEKVKIIVNGHDFFITASLHGALKALRKKDEPVFIWADYLCIDQNNREERSQHLQLMPTIYDRAESVAIWLGPQSTDSYLAFELINALADEASAADIFQKGSILKSWKPKFTALVRLFERQYWTRLWVVQEVLNAGHIDVYCGETIIPWTDLVKAQKTLQSHSEELTRRFPPGYVKGTQQRLPYANVLCQQGPMRIEMLRPLRQVKNTKLGTLLEVLHTCRTKLASEPKDKVFAVYGILDEGIRRDFHPDYSKSLREVYTDVIDQLLHTTEKFDVICHAIHFPRYTSMAGNLPTFVPDWSHVPQISPLSSSFKFTAAEDTHVKFRFCDALRTKLQISAIYIDTVKDRGISVAAYGSLDDTLMAFLHWRAKLLAYCGKKELQGIKVALTAAQNQGFCRTICLGQHSQLGNIAKDWPRVCYHSFAVLLKERLPFIPFDNALYWYAAHGGDIKTEDRRNIVESCSSKMMGRRFFITSTGLLGMGSGLIEVGDVICIPLGSSTPVVIRHDDEDNYQFIGDTYIDNYMDGKGVQEWETFQRELRTFVMH